MVLLNKVVEMSEILMLNFIGVGGTGKDVLCEKIMEQVSTKTGYFGKTFADYQVKFLPSTTREVYGSFNFTEQTAATLSLESRLVLQLAATKKYYHDLRSLVISCLDYDPNNKVLIISPRSIYDYVAYTKMLLSGKYHYVLAECNATKWATQNFVGSYVDKNVLVELPYPTPWEPLQDDYYRQTSINKNLAFCNILRDQVSDVANVHKYEDTEDFSPEARLARIGPLLQLRA
jgi:hypothetical protein